MSTPISIQVDTKGTGRRPESQLVELVKENFDLRPQAIIDHFRLRRPIYQQTAAYGHFGRDDLDLPWEELDRVEMLKG
jgi:S-adenosylmethionine synthetase